MILPERVFNALRFWYCIFTLFILGFIVWQIIQDFESHIFFWVILSSSTWQLSHFSVIFLWHLKQQEAFYLLLSLGIHITARFPRKIYESRVTAPARSPKEGHLLHLTSKAGGKFWFLLKQKFWVIQIQRFKFSATLHIRHILNLNEIICTCVTYIYACKSGN